ncbi:hypothetical protein AZ66_29025 [Paenibacillus sp. E194]|uniref:hypothetical protein n=1 Tax=Paenibacillus sp. E194 TaxID=1458845 RepID=UPI0005CB2DCB|nr:hypothetical protein [Paenibacillus sp. E194]KJB84748.1 hypothetical protein AZ66_29025 [Paenibacillus sp. E194]
MKKNVSLRKLKSKYGRNYTQKNEDFVKSIMMNEIDKSLVKNKLSRNLKKGEVLNAARLLINSCKRSVERVKNKSKVVYYGKQDDWVNDPSDMALFIAKDPSLITKWISTFMHYYDEGKPQNLRPTLERINSDIGYVKGNIDILAYKVNVQNAAGIPCIALVSYEGVLTIFESISIEGIIERLNSDWIAMHSREATKAYLLL